MEKVLSYALLGAGLMACTGQLPDGTSSNEATPTATGSHGVAVVRKDATRTSLVLVDEPNAARATEILDGGNPSQFHWILMRLSGDGSELQNGVSADLSNLTSGVEFAQSYNGPCNPALSNFQPCWLLEDYKSGDSGLSGTVLLQVKDGIVSGQFHVSWTGVTDRFGEPAQQHTHNTDGGIGALLLNTEGNGGVP